MTRPGTLLVDLDGTLVDTLVDLADALAPSLASRGAQVLAPAEIRPMVGDGLVVLVQRAFAARGLPLEPGAIDEIEARYEANASARSRLFPGALDALEAASSDGFRLAICTNKPEAAARRLLADLGMLGRFDAIGAGDTFPVRKPDPGHLLRTLAAAGGTPARAVMIGDHRNDVVAAHGAGIPSIFALWGYGDPVTGADADATAAAWPDALAAAKSLLAAQDAATR